MSSEKAQEETTNNLMKKLMSAERRVIEEVEEDWDDNIIEEIGKLDMTVSTGATKKKKKKKNLRLEIPLEEDDQSLLDGGYDSEESLVKKAMKFTVPSPFTKGSIRIAGPPRRTPKASNGDS